MAKYASEQERLEARRASKRRYREKYPERARASYQKCIAAQGESQKERKREVNRASYERNAEKRRASARDAYHADIASSRERNRRWREQNPERVRESLRASRARHADKIRAIAKVKYAKNADAVKARWKAWRERNPDKAREQTRRAYLRNPERFIANAAKQRAKRIAIEMHPVSARDLNSLAAFYGYLCVACDEPIGVPGSPVHIDHVIPIARGGAHALSNLQPMCGRCNRKKHTRTFDHRPAALGWFSFQGGA